MLANSSLKRDTISLVILFIGTALGALSGFLTKIIIARNTSPEIFGNYTSIITTITTLAPLCGFGIQQYWLKIFGQHSNYGILWIRPSLILISVSSCTIFTILVLWFSISIENESLKLSAIILSLTVFYAASIELLNSSLQIEGRYTSLSFWHILQSSFLLLAIGILVYLFKIPLTTMTLSITQSSFSLIILVLSLPIIYKFWKSQKEKTNKLDLINYSVKHKPKVLNIIKESTPFGLASFFYLIYYQFGIVLVRQEVNPTEAGYYSIALLFLSSALLFPGVIYQKFLLPKLHRWAYHDRKKFIKTYKYGNYCMLAGGLLGLIILWFSAPYIVPIIFGDNYISAVPIVQIMAINIPITYLASNSGALLVTKDHMKIKVYYMFAVALLNLLLMPIMIHKYETIGAVAVNILSNTIICILYYFTVHFKVLKND